MESISIYDTVSANGKSAGPALSVSYKLDAPYAEFAYEHKENNLTRRAAEARALGVSYGQYMAMLKDGAVEDPLAQK